MNTIEILEKKDCCGCSSCYQKCPKNAIEMLENEEGFLYPKINKEKCINCGLCSKVCPQLKKARNMDNGYPKAYAMQNKNKEEVKESSSGGIFSIIANYVIDNNGIVFGAAYSDDLDINHIKITDKEELQLLRGSKYVQSNIKETYKEAENALKDNKLVFFTGTPCQIAGLNNFLGKEFENLITADFVCHGVPSQKLFHKYLKYLSKKYKSKVVKYNFRTKEKRGWALISKIETIDGKIRYKEPQFDPYYSNFLKHTIYRESCYKCHYSNYNRVSNITLADYFAIIKTHPDFYKDDGISLILLNDKKGEELFNKISSHIEYIETDLDIAAQYNENLIEPSSRPDVRNNIYNGIDDMQAETFIKNKLKVDINTKNILLSIIPANVKKIIKKVKVQINRLRQNNNTN